MRKTRNSMAAGVLGLAGALGLGGCDKMSDADAFLVGTGVRTFVEADTARVNREYYGRQVDSQPQIDTTNWIYTCMDCGQSFRPGINSGETERHTKSTGHSSFYVDEN